MKINQLSNGSYIKAMICGVKNRTHHSQKDNRTYEFYSLVVEESALENKKQIQLSKMAADAGLHHKLNDPKYSGKTCLIPFYCSSYNGITNYHYSGSDLPVFIADSPRPTATPTTPNRQAS